MSGRFASRESTPSPPKSKSPKRRPLHQRSESEVNERNPQAFKQRSVHAVDDQENGNAATTPSFDLPKIYTTSPFPAFESQILRPFPELTAQRPAHAGSVAIAQSTPTTQPPTHNRHATTTPPVIIDHRSSLRSHDSEIHDASIRSSFQSGLLLPDNSLSEAGLVTPASTIRFVDDYPSTSSHHAAMTNTSFLEAALLPNELQPDEYSPSISDLPSLPRENQYNFSIGTPTPAARPSRPTIRTIANLQSDATQTPASARSANSNGTQLHRRVRNAEDALPRGSYLHFADRRIRRSTSDPELASSPIVQRLYDSASPSPLARRPSDLSSSPNVRRFEYSPHSPLRRVHRLSSRSSRNFSSPVSAQSPATPDRFPALTRYVQAASPRSPSPTPRNRGEFLRSPRRQFRPAAHQRWSSVESTSDLRSMSMSPSEIGSDMGALLEEPSTIESALSVSIASAHPSIRVVEGSSPSQAEFNTPDVRTARSRYREETVVPEPTTNSPVWVSYSSPVTHLPYVGGESAESLPTPEISRNNVNQREPSSSETTPTTPNAQDIIYPANSSNDARMPNMRRRSTMRQTISPFFTPGSGRSGQLRQSTITQSPIQTPELSFNFGFEREPTQAATSAFQPSPNPSEISSLTQSEAGTPEINNGRAWPTMPTNPPPRSPLRPRIPFPAGGSSSIGNTPVSIHIPRNRHSQMFDLSALGHSRNQTYGGESPRQETFRSSVGSRRSSSPTVPSIDYRDNVGPSAPFTPPAMTRPSNPTPGVTPATTRTNIKSMKSPISRLHHENTFPDSSPLPEIAPLRPPRPKRVSLFLPDDDDASAAGSGTTNRMHIVRYPNLPPRRGGGTHNNHVNNDWTPHLWHGASHTLNRRSAFMAPSINSTSAPFLKGAKARRDLQMLLFMIGFLIPPCWLVASLLPLPAFGQVEGLGALGHLGGGRSERLAKGKSIIGGADLEKEVQWTADEVAGYESARWWRRVNRCLAAVGLGVCLVLIVVGVVTSHGGIQNS